MPLTVLQTANVQTANACETCPHRAERLFCNLTPKALRAFGAIGTSATFSPWRDALSRGRFVRRGACGLLGPGQALVRLSRRQDDDPEDRRPRRSAGARARHWPGFPTRSRRSRSSRSSCATSAAAAFLAFLNEYGEASLHAAQSMQSEYRTAFLDARLMALTSSAAGRLAHVPARLGPERHLRQERSALQHGTDA